MQPAFLREVRYREEESESHEPIEGAFPTLLFGIGQRVLGVHDLTLVDTEEPAKVEGVEGEVIVMGVEHWNLRRDGEFTDGQLARKLGDEIIQQWEASIVRLNSQTMTHIDKLHNLPA